MSDESRVGRLDLLAQEGLGRICAEVGRRLGFPSLREHVQPVIDRYVAENVTRHRIPVTPVDLAEEMGLIRRQQKRVE